MTVKPTYEELERRVQELEKIESEYKSSKETSRENESLFKTLYEKIPLGYQSLDENGHFIIVNQTWLVTLGYTREEVIGKSFADFLHPDWRDHFKENFPRFKSIGEILGVEFEMVKKNGTLILVSFTGKISRDKKGDFQQTHCIFHDITDRKQMETDLRRSRDGLEEQVQKRTAELEKLNEALKMEVEKRKKFETDLKLQNKKILKAQERRKYLSKKLVEILEKERRAIAESLHNDVGQILAKLNMDLDDVIDASEHAPIKADALVQIQSSIMESMDYISWLAGSLRPHILENLGLVPAIRNMLNKMKKNSNVRFNLHTQGDFLQIDDEKALAVYRITQEAVTNCLKHARAENIIVNLTRNDQFLSITIEDDGPGFEHDKISAKEGEKDKLGLIIMHERAIQVGGEFRITSRVGKGTRVTVETPVE